MVEKNNRFLKALSLSLYISIPSIVMYTLTKMLHLIYFNKLNFSNIAETFESIQLGTYFINFIFGPILLILILYSNRMSTFNSLSKFLKLVVFSVTLTVYFFQYKNTDFDFEKYGYKRTTEVVRFLEFYDYYTINLSFDVSYLDNQDKVVFEGENVKFDISKNDDSGLKIGKNKRSVMLTNNSGDWQSHFIETVVENSAPVFIEVSNGDSIHKWISANIVEYKDEFQSDELKKYQENVEPIIEKVEFIPLKIDVSFYSKGKSITETSKGYYAIIYRKYSVSGDELNKIKKEHKIKEENKILKEKLDKISE